MRASVPAFALRSPQTWKKPTRVRESEKLNFRAVPPAHRHNQCCSTPADTPPPRVSAGAPTQSLLPAACQKLCSQINGSPEFRSEGAALQESRFDSASSANSIFAELIAA